MKKIIFSLILSFLFLFVFQSRTYAVECYSDLKQNQTISTTCTLPVHVDGDNNVRYMSGIDMGTGTTNTSRLTVSSGTITINSNETLSFGTLILSGGSIAIATGGGAMRPGKALWTMDADGDGYRSISKIWASNVMPVAGAVRLNTIVDLTVLDCDDSTFSANNICRRTRDIVITNGTGGTLTNHDIVVSLDTASLIASGKMTSDCGDIRVYNSDDFTALTYWIEGGCNTSTTQIWIRVPSIPAGNKTIYLKYDGDTLANGTLAWTGGKFTLLSDGTCPNGWTHNANYDNRFLFGRPGGAAPGTNGGTTSHTHADSTGTTAADLSPYNWRGGLAAHVASNHTHTFTAAVSAGNNAVPWVKLYFCDTTNLRLPSGMIALFTTTVPFGWTRYSTLDSKFPYGEPLGGGGVGTSSTTNTHTHPMTLATSVNANRVQPGNGAVAVSTYWSHDHVGTSYNSAAGTALPPYLNMIYGKVDLLGGVSPSAGIIAILDVDAIPPLGWIEFTALNNYFPQGAATYGGTGGATTHTHTYSATTAAGGGSVNNDAGGGGNFFLNTRANHTHTFSGTTGAGSSYPNYRSAIFVQRKTPSVTVSLGTEYLKDCFVGTWYTDADGDGYGAGAALNQCQALGYSSNNTDCNDADALLYSTVSGYRDADGDGYGAGSLQTCGNPSYFYVANNTDCDDTNPNGYRIVSGYRDADGDGYGAGVNTTCGVNGSYVANASDCYDGNANAYPNSIYCGGANRGDGSFDYNCSGTQTKCGTTYNLSCTNSGTGTFHSCIGPAGARTCGGTSILKYETPLTSTCGQSACICAGTGGTTTCSSDGARCYKTDTWTGCTSVTQGVQTCQ